MSALGGKRTFRRSDLSCARRSSSTDADPVAAHVRGPGSGGAEASERCAGRRSYTTTLFPLETAREASRAAGGLRSPDQFLGKGRENRERRFSATGVVSALSGRTLLRDIARDGPHQLRAFVMRAVLLTEGALGARLKLRERDREVAVRRSKPSLHLRRWFVNH